QRVDEFDFESETKKQLRGNIYLAKVTRVEPSLQAAFVDYGGNRHGFLAFSEIHPDYYQIPTADREELLRAQAEEVRLEEQAEAAVQAKAAEAAETDEDGDTTEDGDARSDVTEAGSDAPEKDADDSDDAKPAAPVEATGSEDATEEVRPRRERKTYRSYKIQDVIKRRQIILVQVVKEERGNKGAALTTYLSLAGRYCVLMPNTARGGGISRKITNAADRKRLKSVAEGLDVASGMGLIVRTAGAKRTKPEIKRDFEYLLRLWENVRDLTLKSYAPCLVYEEGSLIKRSIRDLYDKEIESVLVQGDDAYREAKDFMRMLMPSHAKKVQPYTEAIPLFQKQQVEPQLDAMFSPEVTLKSGGYLVINPTEALVSIDINSGRSTKERNIEATALKTNLEAAEEIARQLRLRDLAGLVVIDFIDMEENRNNRAVERKMKDCLKTDRARIQVGRISHFGLLEMSRQRMRTGVLEGSSHTCPLCEGAGIVRAVESTALHVLRAIEAEAIKGRANSFTAKVPTEVALYILNQKRANLLSVEATYGVSVYLEADTSLKGAEHLIEVAEPRNIPVKKTTDTALSMESAYTAADAVADAAADAAAEAAEAAEEAADAEEEARENDDEAEGDGKRKRRRRRRRRKSPGEEGDDNSNSTSSETEEDAAETETAPESEDTEGSEENASDETLSEDDEDGDKPKRRRRRGRRGGRRNRRKSESDEDNASTSEEDGDSDSSPASEVSTGTIVETGDADTTTASADLPTPPPVLVSYSMEEPAPSTPEPSAPATEAVVEAVASAEPLAEKPVEVAPEPAKVAAEAVSAAISEAPATEEAVVKELAAKEETPAKPRRKGWWQRS
ncbi:MAG: Rne/Rng family ribonuclease, partial [Parvibaculaceae bacterium]|nr:Rne/Rng family ribonuclease [Parvibaculaceae bacterium]